jgi:hypothetical protein
MLIELEETIVSSTQKDTKDARPLHRYYLERNYNGYFYYIKGELQVSLILAVGGSVDYVLHTPR